MFGHTDIYIQTVFFGHDSEVKTIEPVIEKKKKKLDPVLSLLYLRRPVSLSLSVSLYASVSVSVCLSVSLSLSLCHAVPY